MRVPGLAKGTLYLRTARYLRWRQWVYRAIRRVQANVPEIRHVETTPHAVREARLAAAFVELGPGDAEGRLRRAQEVCGGRFTFLGQTEEVESPDWVRRSRSHLWSYNLHYFDYAVDLAWAHRLTGDPRFVRRFEELADGWIAATADGRGDGWEPYPLSLRTVNWTRALLLAGDALGADFRARVLRSLARQVATLERRLEWHLLANHLQKNLCALVLGGLLFDGAAARRWRERGARLLWAEVEEQIHPDGGHFERSPMYHAIALADLLELGLLLRACGHPIPERVLERLDRMTDAMGALSRPDGTLHLLNDSANGIAPPRAWIDRLALRLVGHPAREPSGRWSLPDLRLAGYNGAASGERLVFDAGAPGPSYQPAHAHCGLLGFELDLFGRPVVVDSGVSGYEGDPLREYVRSTRAHNTVTVDGREQSEVWGTFRLGRRAREDGWEVDGRAGGFHAAAAYRPYHDRRVRHRRTIVREGVGHWTITDQVEGSLAPLQSYLHLHPAGEVEVRADGVRVRFPEGAIAVELTGIDGFHVLRGSEDPVQGWYCPEFGQAIGAPTLEMSIQRNDGRRFGYSIRALEHE